MTTGNHSRVLFQPSLASILIKLPRNVSPTNLTGGLSKLVKLSRINSTCSCNRGIHALRQISLTVQTSFSFVLGQEKRIWPNGQ